MIDLESRDPAQALIWSFGMIGSRLNSVFAQYLKQADKLLNWTPKYYTGGLDLGVSDSPTSHPTSASMWCLNDKMSRLYKLNEWFHDNATMARMPRTNVLDNVILFFFNEMRLRKIKYLIVRVDYGNGGAWALDLLNNKYNSMQSRDPTMEWYSLQFTSVKKELYYLKDRVDFTVIGIQNDWIAYNFSKCVYTRKQYGLMKYKTPNENSKNTYELIDKNDDCWDADFYAWCPFLKTLIENNNKVEYSDKSKWKDKWFK